MEAFYAGPNTALRAMLADDWSPWGWRYDIELAPPEKRLSDDGFEYSRDDFIDYFGHEDTH